MHDQTTAQLDHWTTRSRQGDREAFAELVRQYQSKVSAVTFSMTGNHGHGVTGTIPLIPGIIYISPQIVLGVSYFGAALTAYLIARRQKRRSVDVISASNSDGIC